MLHNPKWEVEIKTDPFSLNSLIAWLEQQPADKSYNYWDCKGACLYGLYTAALGIEWKESGHFDDDDGSPRSDFCDFVYSNIAYEIFKAEMTFGAALARARALSIG